MKNIQRSNVVSIASFNNKSEIMGSGDPFFEPGVENNNPSLYKYFISEERERLVNSYLLSKRPETIRLARACFEDESFPGWDGYDAVPVKLNSFKNAEWLLQFFTLLINEPDVCSTSNGEIYLEWRSDNKVLGIEVGDTYFNYSFIIFAEPRCKKRGQVPLVTNSMEQKAFLDSEIYDLNELLEDNFGLNLETEKTDSLQA